MKKLILLLCLVLGQNGFTNELDLDLSDRSFLFQEGTERTLTPDQIEELIPWANNSRTVLVDLLESTNGLSKSITERRLVSGIKDVVLASAPKNTELLMRYVLNRAILVHEYLVEELDERIPGNMNTRVRLLKQSIEMALKYYESDLALLQGQLDDRGPIQFAAFGKHYVYFLLDLSKSIFDASAQYEVSRMSLEFLQWDLYRDLGNKAYAADILKINSFLKLIPESAQGYSDQHLIAELREIKKLYQRLELRVENVRIQTPVINRPAVGGQHTGGVQPLPLPNHRGGLCAPFECGNKTFVYNGGMYRRLGMSDNYYAIQDGEGAIQGKVYYSNLYKTQGCGKLNMCFGDTVVYDGNYVTIVGIRLSDSEYYAILNSSGKYEYLYYTNLYKTGSASGVRSLKVGEQVIYKNAPAAIVGVRSSDNTYFAVQIGNKIESGVYYSNFYRRSGTGTSGFRVGEQAIYGNSLVRILGVRVSDSDYYAVEMENGSISYLYYTNLIALD